MFQMAKRVLLSTTLTFSLLAGSALPFLPASAIYADADTAVTNKQNFSTDVIYQVLRTGFWMVTHPTTLPALPLMAHAAT